MAHKKQEEICQMFDRIANTYDPVNRILSWGQDVSWRRSLASLLPKTDKLWALDIACGTADIAIAMCQARPTLELAFGIDLSANMLAIGQKKIVKLGLDHQIKLVVADACALPFDDHSFDVVSIAFGIRNITHMEKALAEMVRVLRPGGRALILEFSLPQSPIIRFGYLAYFRHVLPLLGALMSQDAQAYRYLNRTVESFPRPEDFAHLLRLAGFSKVSLSSLSFGVATLYCAEMS